MFSTVRPLVDGGSVRAPTPGTKLRRCFRTIPASNQQFFPISSCEWSDSGQQSALGHQSSTRRPMQKHSGENQEQLPTPAHSAFISCSVTQLNFLQSQPHGRSASSAHELWHTRPATKQNLQIDAIQTCERRLGRSSDDHIVNNGVRRVIGASDVSHILVRTFNVCIRWNVRIFMLQILRQT